MIDKRGNQKQNRTDRVNLTVSLALLMTACVLLLPARAAAVERCDVKVDKATGAMQVNARGLSGPLFWGDAEGQEIHAFYDQSCLSPSRARNCLLDDPTTTAATTPPASCRLYFADDVSTCSAFVAGCTPGVRAQAPDERFGTNTSYAHPGRGAECVLGEVWLTAGHVASGIPAEGQLLDVSRNVELFSLLGTTYGGDGRTTFGLPDLRDAAPNGLTYVICTVGRYPSRL